VSQEICFTPARKLARLIRARKLSATEVMRAFIAQIERINPQVNAIVTFLPEQALKQARAFDKKPTKLPFAGLPIAMKDLIATKGVRTTWGSLVHKDHVPAEDHIMAERLKAAGAILIGKTNTPEFGAGSQTFNKVFGATRNPYDLSKTCGGSSGGAGVAVATGMLPFADGGDFAASLRNPGSYCNVIGFRPSTGRVPAYPHPYPWSTLSELGPMARTVSDAAFLLSVQAGPDRRAPTSISEPGSIFLKPLKRSFRKARVAWSRDLGGLLPPFPVDQDYPREIAGVKMTNYLDWMKSCYYITLTTHPAISVPAGFTDDGLPVGMQIVGRYRDDFGVLQFAHAFEQATEVWKRRPPIV
jgi:amidase